MALQTAALRVLGADDTIEALRLLDADPVQNVFIASRVHAAGLDSWRLGAEIWGYSIAGRLAALCHVGANLSPAVARDLGDGDVSDALRAFAERAANTQRRCSSIVGPAPLVAPLWTLLEPSWGPARDVRGHQPVLALSATPRIAPDPLVRPVQTDEIDLLVPACVAMFTEELGVSPLANDGGRLYRARIADLVQAGRAFARIDHGVITFKAELGVVSPYAAQVQGVWVPPDHRGRGLSNGGMAAVAALTVPRIAPTITLYVNDYNAPARAAYRRVGFAEVGTAMTVLF